MLKTTILSNLMILSISLFFGIISYAQVGIGTTSPEPRSILDLRSTDKGFLVPRVNITNLGNIAPITGGATSEPLLVWNTNVGTGTGFHYWSGSTWVPLSSSSGNHWSLNGNTITTANFLGTINGLDLNVRTANTNRLRVQSNGQVTVGFGAGAANAGDQLSSVGTYGVAGYSGTTGTGVYGQNISSGNGVWGLNNSSGNGVYGYNNSSGDAVHAEHDGSGNAVDAVAYGSGVGVYAENFAWTDYAIQAVDGIASVFADNTLLGFDAIIADTDDPVSNSLWARNTNTAGTAVLGGASGIYVFATNGSGVAGSSRKLGVFGYAGTGTTGSANYGNAGGQFTLDSDNNPATTTGNTGTRATATIAGYDNISPNGSLAVANSYFGGYFLGGNINGAPSYAYAGIKYGTNAAGTTGTNYKIIGNGTNSTIIKDNTNTPRILFSPEAPEILFEDYGTGKLINGVAEILIDPVLKDAIYVDENHPLKVFIQLEGDCNGVYVTNKSANGFTVKELGNGVSNVSFSYHIVANRADEIGSNGEISSKHVGLRFPVGPAPLKETSLSVRKEGDNKNDKNLNSKKNKNRRITTENEGNTLSEDEVKEIIKKVDISQKN
ncbi:hypothetical protein M0G43_07685 [Subsaxibacter sp. CAU 1640]|uniref:hypothetical protein n=1 Tax=Subsaxibacter sp. CAU 1640 TaxID=2933271 RepID=UPI00200333DB|nr:hypothetical protein [Subsaxibacter sp. CAU 1640]MCK7590447.1 hypothetical protein [Subsaxibacter sp. CAU 1640]